VKQLSVIIPALFLAFVLPGCATTKPAGSIEPGKEAATKVQPSGKTPEDYYQLGRQYQGRNQLDEAIQTYQKALALDPHLSKARDALGVAYSQQGKFDLAIEQFQALIKETPREAHLHNNLGYAYYLLGRYPEAIASLETATRLDPGDAAALNNLGLAYAKAGDQEKSRAALDRAAQLLSQQRPPSPATR
jgi:tetratricopeptide (TPR) repeat protein